jgi:LysM repeat protein
MKGSIWVDKFGRFQVTRKEMPRVAGANAYLLNTHTETGVLHTTQGLGMQNIWNALYTKGGKPFRAAPHLILGLEAAIWQLRPFDVQAAALRGAFANANAALQIEMEGFTGGPAAQHDEAHHGTDPWDLPPLQREALIEIMVWAAGPPLDIPIVRANPNWRDDLKDIGRTQQNPRGIIATPNNSRRLSGTFPRAKGWYGHVDVPNSDSGHYDPGALNWTGILADARSLFENRTRDAAKGVNVTGMDYVVQAGDGLYAIARKAGIPFDALLAANGLTAQSTIKPGQYLVIPK